MHVVEQLNGWDYFFDKDSKEAVYYDIWFSKLFSSIWDEIKSSNENNISLAYPTDNSTIKLMKQFPDLEFFDNKNTETIETVKDLILMSFREMMKEVATLKLNGEIAWGPYKSTFIGHQLRIKPLGYYNINTGGSGGDVVNATGTNHGPSERIIVELDPNGIKAWGHYPGGQSGNPGSKYYDNMVEAWANGEYYELLFLKGPDQTNSRIIFSQTLTSK
jgi:penicillin amidase